MSTLSSASNLSLAGLTGQDRIAVNGLVSGIDTTSLINGLLAIDQAKITRVDQRTQRIDASRKAFKGLEARILAVQGTLSQLARSRGNVFEGKKATSSLPDIATVAATNSAVPGSYRFNVQRLASAHQVGSQGFESASTAITQGTLTIKTGATASATITIDSSNSTLQGLADAINGSNEGVTATIIGDGGSAGTQPYRLLLSAKETGAANRIEIVNNLAASSGGAVRPFFDSSSIGSVFSTSTNTSTSAVSTNTGQGVYTGATNNEYTFTVVSGGVVGTDNNLQLSYTDRTGAHTGTITLNAADVGVAKSVAEGIETTFAAGTLVAGDTFKVKTTVAEIQKGEDALVTLGSGSGAISVTSGTNQLTNLISGATIDLLSADPTKPVTVSITSDTGKSSQAIQDLVSAYNDLFTYIQEQSSYDPESKVAGILLGNTFALGASDQIRSAMTNAVQGVKAQMSHLRAVGITTNDQGRLVVDASKLSDALDGKIAGATEDDVRRLFSLSGLSDKAGVQFITASTKTNATGSPLTVRITQAAEQATLSASTALAATTVIDGTNNSIKLSVDGKSSNTIAIAQGTYSRQGLADAIQAAIRSDDELKSRNVTVSVANDKLTFISATYGLTSNVALSSANGWATLGFGGTESAQGKDVAGSFVVGGVTEEAVGSGQFLVGNSTNAGSADLQVRVTLNAAQVGAGIDSSLTISRGIASAIDSVVTGLLDPINGRVKTINDGYQAETDRLGAIMKQQQEIIAAKRERMLLRFANMERTLSQLQAVGNQAVNQLAGLSINK